MQRVSDARNRGQLLVFSPTFRNPAPLPPSPESEDIGAANPEPESSPEPSIEQENEDSSLTPQNMEVNITVNSTESTKSGITSAQSSHQQGTHHHHHQSEEIANELKSMREMIDKLVNSKDKSSEASASQLELLARQEQLQKLTLEAQSIKTDALATANSKLERKNEELQATIKELEAKLSSEKESHLVEKTKLEVAIGSTERETEARIQGLEDLKSTLEQQLGAMQDEKEKLLQEIQTLEQKLSTASEKLKESKENLSALMQEKQHENATLSEEREELEQVNQELQSKVADMTKQNEVLGARISEYEERVHHLENQLLPETKVQLEDALEKLERHEEAAKDVSNMIPKYEEQIKTLQSEIESTKQEMEEERANFQSLNEQSSLAFEKISKDSEAKDEQIQRLQGELADTQKLLDAESDKLQSLSGDLQTTNANLIAKVRHLESALSDTMQELEKSESQKKQFEAKLNEALTQMEKDAKFKEDVMEKNNEQSAVMKEMTDQRADMQRKILELEHKLKTTSEERDAAKERLETFDQREDELFNKLQESDRLRRHLHNKVIQLCGNIRVYVRVRPALPNEANASDIPDTGRPNKRKHSEIEEKTLFHYPGIYDGESKRTTSGNEDPTKNMVEVTEPYKDRGGLSDRRKKWRFGFDHVFNPHHKQDDIWEATAPLVQSAVDGFNVTVFAYGQTGSGKTYTMLGEEGNKGIVTRSVEMLFKAKQEIEALSRGETNVELSVELLEIYNEKVRDLLADGNDGKEINLKVTSKRVVGNIIVPAQDEEQVAKILDKAQKRRTVKATSSNAVSSRSHMLFTIHFKATSKNGTVRSGKLNVCDLAGSERLNKSNANSVGGALLKETKHINTSLSVLSNVIEKLQAGDSNVPFRESKLTYLLQDSLGGNSKTLAIVCCNPLPSHFHESLCSLRFAEKVNKVDLKAVANFSA